MSTTTVEARAAAETDSGITLLRPLRRRDFRLLFAGETISVLGDQFHFVALAWLTLTLTGSGLALGTVLMTAAIPRAAFMLLGGAFSDRFSPRSLMLWSNVVRAVVVGLLAVLVITDQAALWHLYVLAGIFGVVDAFFYPALNTIVPMLVPERQLAPANALVQGAQQVMNLVGPAAAGAMVAIVQTGPAFAVDSASFAIASVAILAIAGGRRLPAAAQDHDHPRPSILATIGSGVRAAWGDPAVRALIFLTTAFNLAFSGPISVGLAWLAETRFLGGPAAFGLLISAWGGGAVIGSVIGGSIRRLPKFGTSALLIALMLAVGLVLMGFVSSLPLAMAVLAAMGVLAGLINVQVFAWLQARIPDELRGRVLSLVMLGSFGLAPVSLVVAGILVEIGAITPMFIGAGAIVAAAVVAGFALRVPEHMSGD